MPVDSPQLVVLNEQLASDLGLNVDALKENEGVRIFSGNDLPPGASPLAQAYAGHQFGHLTMLGDGRAILLGEHVAPDGTRWDIQLKGSGRTPYSRGGDGRAALGPMLREYIMSEAMHALGIPTTRSLAVVTTGETIVREQLQEGAILTRVASSHLRVGTFQFARGRATPEELETLADYALWRHGFGDPERFITLLKEVIQRQASLVAKWQLVGFIHGVMNTDNMTISGETIDYGPCAMMDVYDPATVFSSIDRNGRYAYGRQPHIAGWNLARFAETLLPLLHDDEEEAVEMAQDALERFGGIYEDHWTSGMRAKLGLFGEEEADTELIKELLEIMKNEALDYTNTFRALTLDQPDQYSPGRSGAFSNWYEKWQLRLKRQEQSRDEVQDLMKSANPAIIPRNHRVEEALAAATEHGDLTVMHRLLDALANPYAYTPNQAEYVSPPPASARPYQTFCGT